MRTQTRTAQDSDTGNEQITAWEAGSTDAIDGEPSTAHRFPAGPIRDSYTEGYEEYA